MPCQSSPIVELKLLQTVHHDLGDENAAGEASSHRAVLAGGIILIIRRTTVDGTLWVVVSHLLIFEVGVGLGRDE